MFNLMTKTLLFLKPLLPQTMSHLCNLTKQTQKQDTQVKQFENNLIGNQMFNFMAMNLVFLKPLLPQTMSHLCNLKI